MNTTPYMDKQIMDLTHGSSQSMDFIDLINHPKEEDDNDEDGAHHGSHQIGGNGIKKEDIAPSYDFQPIRPLGASTQSSNYDSTPNLGAYSRSWNPTDSKSNSTHTILNYGSLNSIEPTKDTVEKDRNVFDATIMSEIDRTVKKHTDNLLHVLEGVSARLTQMESRTQHLESSMDDLKVSIGNNHGSSDGKMRQLENVLREVQEGVQVIKDKQEIVEAQLKLAKLQVSKVDQQSETQSTVHMDPAQHAASAPLQSQQQLPPPANLPQSLPALHPPNSPPHPPYQSTPQQGLPPSVQLPVQFPPNQVPSVVPQREPYFPPRGQSQDTPNQQYQLPPSQQSHSSPGAPPLQQYQPAPQPQYSQPPTHPPQQQPSHPPVSLPQLQPSLSHHLEETSYGPSQNYPHSLRQLPSQPPSGPPTSQQFYGAPSHAYEPPSSRPGYVAPSGPPEPYHYGGSPQYGGTSPLKQPQLSSPAMATSGGSGYPQLPTARVLPHAVPTTSGVSGGSGSAGTGDRVPVDDVVDKVTSMGFPRDHVRATVRRLTENGQAVDLNIVLDKLMNDSEVQPPRGWFGR